MEQTNGRGVDLVLNSLIGEKLQASIRCLAYHGRFLEIGKVDLLKNAPLGILVFYLFAEILLLLKSSIDIKNIVFTLTFNSRLI